MGSRKKTLSTIAPPCFPYFLRTSSYYYASLPPSSYYYASLPRSREIEYPLPIVASHGNEIESTINADCQRRKETLNSVAGMTSNTRKR